MQISIKYNDFYKTIDCPHNTFSIGVKMNRNMNMMNCLHHFFDNIECIEHKEILPDNTKIKFYFYTCNHPEINNLKNLYKDLTILKITGKDFIVETI